MEEHLFSILDAACDFPVVWGAFGSGATLPRAVVHRTGGLRDLTLDGPGLMQGRIQVDCYGATYLEAVTASRTVRAALEFYKGGPIEGLFLDTIRDGIEDDAQLLRRVQLTFAITYRD